jgi:Phage integrase, N-terminal SAM-like domain
MTTIATASTTIQRPEPDYLVDDAQLAAAAFLSRYSGRTLDAYRDDLRGFFQWAADNQVVVLEATRPHIELYRCWMDERGLAASTIDRRLSTVCGFYRFAHIDGRIGSNPAQYVRRPRVHPPEARGLDRSELGVFLFGRPLRPRPRGARRVARAQRVAGQRGVRQQRRGPWPRTGSPHAAHPRQGRQAGHHPAGSSPSAHHRPGCRRAVRGTDSAPALMATTRARSSATRRPRRGGLSSGRPAGRPAFFSGRPSLVSAGESSTSSKPSVSTKNPMTAS